MRRRKRSKSSGSSLQIERGERRKKGDTSKDKCQMRERWLLGQRSRERRGRERETKLYYLSHRAVERVCIGWVNTEEERERKKERDWERHRDVLSGVDGENHDSRGGGIGTETDHRVVACPNNKA